MGWDLESKVILGAECDAARLAVSFVESLSVAGGSALDGVEIAFSRPDWNKHGALETWGRNEVGLHADFASIVGKYLGEMPDDAMVEAQVRVSMQAPGPSVPRPSLYLFGPKYALRRSQGRECDAVISFGPRSGYRGAKLAGGATANEALVLSVLEGTCTRAQPESVFLPEEEQSEYPLNYLFVYHRDPLDFLDDVSEIVELTVRGGRSLADGRSSLPAARSDRRGETMLFGKRTGEYLERVRAYATSVSLELDRQGMPQTVDPSIVEEALVLSEDGFLHAGGIAVYGEPFLTVYCESFYFQLMDRLARLAAGGPREG